MAGVVVVPLDQSEVSERALPVARAIAQQLDARIHLLSVLEVPPGYADLIDDFDPQDPDIPGWFKERSQMLDYLGQIAGSLEPLEVSIQIRLGIDPAMEIDDCVLSQDDSVLVISTHGRSGWDRLVLGSTASKLVALAEYPVVVVPAAIEHAPSEIADLLVALDGSSFAENALHVALGLFAGELHLHLLRIVEPIPVLADIDRINREQLYELSGKYLADLAEYLNEEGCDVTWSVEEDLDVANRIVSVARERNVDLIALATHGRTGFSRLFLGSVADAVLKRAEQPVLLVRPSEQVVARAPENRRLRGRKRS